MWAKICHVYGLVTLDNSTGRCSSCLSYTLLVKITMSVLIQIAGKLGLQISYLQKLGDNRRILQEAKWPWQLYYWMKLQIELTIVTIGLKNCQHIYRTCQKMHQFAMARYCCFPNKNMTTMQYGCTSTCHPCKTKIAINFREDAKLSVTCHELQNKLRIRLACSLPMLPSVLPLHPTAVFFFFSFLI